MKTKILDKLDEVLLNRTKVEFEVEQEGKATASRDEIRKQLAAQLGTTEDLISIDKIDQKFGESVSRGIAYLYSKKEDMDKITPKHIAKRDAGKEKKEKPAEVPKETPAEKPAEEKK